MTCERPWKMREQECETDFGESFDPSPHPGGTQKLAFNPCSEPNPELSSHIRGD